MAYLDPLYWKDPKYPKRIIPLGWKNSNRYITPYCTVPSSTNYLNLENRWEYTFLIPIPIRVINLKYSFQNTKFFDQDFGEIRYGDIWNWFNKDGPEEIAKYLRSTGNDIWEWKYMEVTLLLTKLKFSRFHNYFPTMDKLLENLEFTYNYKKSEEGKGLILTLLKSKHSPEVANKIFEKNPTPDRIFGHLGKRIFEQDFPKLIFFHLDKLWEDLLSFGEDREYGRLRSEYLDRSTMMWSLSYYLGLLPMTPEQIKNPLELPYK